jgi:hypothetical protein
MIKKSKFDGINFSPADVELWTPTLNVSAQGFRCLRGEFVTYWKQGRIAREVAAHICRCWILRHQEALVGYITLFADKLVVQTELLEEENVRYRTFPAVKIGLLATDKRVKGAGTCLVEWAMDYVTQTLSPAVGVRFLTVDALYDPDTDYDSSGFYDRFGFRFANSDETLPPSNGYRTMYFDLKPLIDTLEDS